MLVSLTSRDQTGAVSVTDSDITMTTPSLLSDQEEHQLPDGCVVGVVRGGADRVHYRWELRHTPLGREYYVNHYTKSTQWEHPTRCVCVYVCV